MPTVTYHVAMPYLRSARGRLKEGEPQQAASPSHARRMAEAMAKRVGPTGGAVAFSRRGDPDMGEWTDAVILATYGEVPLAIEDATSGGRREWPEAIPA